MASKRSSMSRNDMWQPEQPSSQTVAIRFLLMDHAGAKARILSLARRSAKALLFHSTITFIARGLLRAGLAVSFVLLAHHGQVGQELTAFEHFRHGSSLFKQRAGWAHMDAFAATGTGFRQSPWVIEVGDDLGVDAAPHDVPGMRTLDFVTDANAARAENAAVVIDHKTIVGGINFFFGIAVRKMDVGDAEALAEHLHLAVTVRNTDRADVIPLCKEQLQNHLAIFLQAFGVGGDFHSFFDRSDTGRQQLVLALDFDEAEAAGADVRQAVHFAEPRDEDAVLASNVENRFVVPPAEVAAIDPESLDRGRAHAVSPTGCALQTPAGHLCSSICARYSSAKERNVLTTGLGAD